MPTYNRAHYIAETIQSIVGQTYSHWELLVMDDGSSDQTETVVAELMQEDDRIHYHNEGNTGLTGLLKNKGIHLSHGTLIAFMDSDDLWPAHKLQQQVDALLQYPEAGFSFTNGYNFSNATGEIQAYFYTRQEGQECSSFFEAACTGTIGIRLPTVLVWKHCLTDEYLFKTGRTFTDFSFITNLAGGYKAVALYEVLFKRRVHETNSSTDGWIADYEEHLETIAGYRQQQKLSQHLANTILCKICIHYGEEYLRRGKTKAARQQFMNAWRHHPLSAVPLKKVLKTLL